MPYRPCRSSQALTAVPYRSSRRIGVIRAFALLVASTLALNVSTARTGANEPEAQTAKALQYTARSDTLDLMGLEQSFRHVANSVTPSVVAITATSDPASPLASFRSTELTARTLDNMLKGGPRVVGTGFCIDAEGYILTNEHVVGEARQLFVTTDSGRTYAAFVVGSDPRSDLAVLKIPAKLPPVSLADPSSLQRGQWTVAIGNPVGLAGSGGMSMSVGIVSAVGRDLPKLSEKEGRLYTNLIQTTAEVNPGNSGGPLFDLQGRVAGIVTAVVLPHKTTNGIGFAMPLDSLTRHKVDQLKRGQPVLHGYLGVAVRDRVGGGVTITRVGVDTPAADILRTGDVITRIEGRPLADETDFIRTVGASPVDRPVALVVERGGREVPISIQLDARQNTVAGVNQSSQRIFWRGLTLGLPQGAAVEGVQVLEVDPRSPMAQQGIRVGSIIRHVAGHPVRDLLTLQTVIDSTPPELARLDLAPGSATARTAYANGSE